MILDMGFVIFLGLLVFGPRKTLEMSQTVGRYLAQFKVAGRELRQQLEEQLSAPPVEPK
jgi:Sec-independent protein translocase protein TatA